jgi:predicted GH43/DUF377 family glycosyl hydrolase
VIWRELGDIRFSDLQIGWAKSHLMGPTPVLISDEVIRIYITCLDEYGIGKPTYLEVSSFNPTKVLYVNPHPILEVGSRGTFDDNGLMLTSVVKQDHSKYLLYYAGFEICEKIRYRIFTGLAISNDAGESFKRFSSTPILDRSPNEEFFRCGSYVLLEDGKFKIWYVGGGSWTQIDGKEMPVYDLKYAESKDGMNWPDKGHTIIPITGDDEHGYGRPWVTILDSGRYEMFYSIRSKSLKAYRLGYATSLDGITWERKDDQVGLVTAPESLATNAIMYSSLISVHGKTYCFYNGDNFGEFGFSISELIT